MPGFGRGDIDWEDVVDGSMCGTGIVEDGTVTYANERLAELHGFDSASNLVGESCTVLVAPTDRGRIDQEVLPRVREDGRWKGTIRGRRIGGDERLLKLSVCRTEAGPLVWSARRGGEEPPSTEMEFARETLETEPVPICIFSATGELRYCNRDAVDFFGADDRADVLGRSLETLVRAEEQNRLRERLRRTVEDREPTGPTEEKVVGLNDEERVANVSTVPVTVDGGTAARVVFEDATDRIQQERKLERYETIIETVDDGIYAMDEDLQFSFVNDGFCELVGLPREEVLGTHGGEFYVDDEEFTEADALRERLVESGNHTGTVRGTYPTPAGERIFESRYRLHPEPDDEFRGSVGIVRDVTEREERQRALERQRDELATFNRINELLFDIVNELVETATREAVERIVCERLAESDLYRFAWIGERELDGEGIGPRERAGEATRGYLKSIAATEGSAVSESGPAGQAMRTGESQAVNVDSMDAEPLRIAASKEGFESILAIPLRYRETVYGVLVVCATRPDAFSEREQRAFTVLGETVGFAINAIKRRRLLFADAFTEIKLRITAPESFLSRASEQFGCLLTVTGHVSADERWILYVDVEGASAERIADAAATDPIVEQVRTIADEDETDRLELVVSDTSLVQRTTTLGVGINFLEFDAGAGHLVVEAPVDTDVRALVEEFDGTFGSAEVLALQELDQLPETTPQPAELAGLLTDRQRQVLEAAFRAGYFARPRTSTGEEIAESLGINTSTFHAHLRKGMRSLIATVFD